MTTDMPRTPPAILARLSVMMFLQYAVWSCWFVTMGPYLNELDFPQEAIGWAYSTTGWGAIFAPFFVGMIADRFGRPNDCSDCCTCWQPG